MSRQVETLQVIVDGKLERELILTSQGRESTRVHGEGFLSGYHFAPLRQVSRLVRRRVITHYGQKGNKVEFETQSHYPLK